MTKHVTIRSRISKKFGQRGTRGLRRTTGEGRAARKQEVESYKRGQGNKRGGWGSYRRAGQQVESFRRAAATYWCTDSCAGLLVCIYLGTTGLYVYFRFIFIADIAVHVIRMHMIMFPKLLFLSFFNKFSKKFIVESITFIPFSLH